MKNLINDPWIPVQLKNNQQILIAPWQITDPNIIAINSPRADFDGALMQFLIGLLQTTCAPKDKNQWIEWLVRPPVLKTYFKEMHHAFDIKGDNPRFMQDFEPLAVKSNNMIADLLIDTPGGNTIKENKDHFVKRGQINALCPSCTMTALFTLQTNAPSGGQGHRTSLRGGGPLTTLVVNDPSNSGLADNLWTNLWLNIINQQAGRLLGGNFDKTADSDIFPWLGKTKTSEKTTGVEIYPENTHPYQMYWGMPRRIRILWEKTKVGACDICNAESETLITHYQTKNYGVNYMGQWIHPLSPYSINKTGENFPLHAQPDGITYRHWLGLIKKQEMIKPAFVVARYQEMIDDCKPLEKEQLRIRAFGYDMDNMKARCWYDSTFPLYVLENSNGVDLSVYINTLTQTAMDVSSMVKSCIKEAWFRRPADAKGDISFLTHAFYQHTEKSFYLAIENLRALEEKEPNEIFNDWHQTLVKSAFSLFNYWVDTGDFGLSDPKRIAKAHTKLKKLLYNKKLLEFLKKEKVA